MTGGAGETVRFVVDGVPLDPVKVDADPFTATLSLAAAEAGRVRAEVMVDGYPRTVTSHLWLASDAADTEAPPECGCAGNARPAGWLALPALLTALAQRRMRRPR